MPEQTNGQAQDIAEIWREWLTQTERQFNTFFSEAMNTDAFSRSVGGYMEMTAAFQRITAESMQRYLTFMNMPSRGDVIGLGETLQMIEGRLARIEEMLQIAAEAVDMEERDATRSEPSRTRRPPSFAPPDEGPGVVPEGLRR